MSDIKFTVNVDEYLSLNKYEVDESMHTSSSSTIRPTPSSTSDSRVPCSAGQARRGRQQVLRLCRLPQSAAPAVLLAAIPLSRNGKIRSLPWAWNTVSAKTLAFSASCTKPAGKCRRAFVSAGHTWAWASGAHARQGTNAAIAFRSFVSEACFTLQSTDVAILRLAVSRFGSAVHALKGDVDAFYPHARGLPRGVCAPKR